jgi:hypothetical protein
VSDENPPQSSLILYQTEHGRTGIQCRFEDKTVWLTQKLMAELFQKDVRTINEHIQNVFAEGELSPQSVIRAHGTGENAATKITKGTQTAFGIYAGFGPLRFFSTPHCHA